MILCLEINLKHKTRTNAPYRICTFRQPCSCFRSADWGNKEGIKCFNETMPIMKRRHWGTGSDKRIMSMMDDVIGNMKVPVTLINITQLSEYRKDAHVSIYTEVGGKLLTDEEKADPLHHADCIHWCLPGVPDIWNQILYAHLV